MRAVRTGLGWSVQARGAPPSAAPPALLGSRGCPCPPSLSPGQRVPGPRELSRRELPLSRTQRVPLPGPPPWRWQRWGTGSERRGTGKRGRELPEGGGTGTLAVQGPASPLLGPAHRVPLPGPAGERPAKGAALPGGGLGAALTPLPCKRRPSLLCRGFIAHLASAQLRAHPHQTHLHPALCMEGKPGLQTAHWTPCRHPQGLTSVCPNPPLPPPDPLPPSGPRG